MESPWCPVFVFALAVCLCCFAPARADGSYGCLFEDDLCQAYEFCVNDGVFGRCQELAGADLNTYAVSSSSLLRLRTLLQKLAHRGLTWHDDITQQVISRELSKLRSSPVGHYEESEVPLESKSGTAGRNAKPGKVELSKNLQRFLKGLHFPPPLQPGVQQEAANTQNEGLTVDGPPDRGLPKLGWKETSVYSLQNGVDQPPTTKVFSQSGEGRHPKLSAPYKTLSKHLEQLFREGGPSGSKGKLRYLGYVRPPPDEVRLAFGSKAPKPNLDGLLFRSGSSQLIAKKPPNFMNDNLFQDMIKHLGGHSFNMDPWMSKDLDQLASVLTEALQEAEARQPDPGAQPGPGTGQVTEGDGDLIAGMESNQVLNVKPSKVLVVNPKVPLIFGQGQQEDGAANKEPVDKHTAIFSKLLDYLDKFGDSSEVQPALGEKAVGLETVRSRTTQSQGAEKGISAPARESSTVRLTGAAARPDSEMGKWMHKPGGNDMTVKTQLVHVGVKEFSSRGKDRHFGYIITGSE